ncbi:putative secreted protein (Por secretion system target) [Jejuia pallidilutea]|uniref:Putative secreted protein (Por secretion system target) n=2 Tax=Jejuia pallidilutea TaxID=504487 RepID=A0A362X446_9FLAO|nr:putative secreted protein (Por secretion system target) [Jejuia pallidilutea]
MSSMKQLFTKSIIGVFILMSFTFSVHSQIVVSSIAELASAASQSGQTVTMTPGVYEMADYLTPTVISNNTPADAFGRRAMIRFSGSNNTFDFTGVTINVDTDLLNDLGGHVIEFHLTGNYINFKGLTVTDIGNSPTASGGQSMTVSGDHITVENVTLNMSGSSPYGYGDLLGKGGGALVPMRKHSGLLVGGLNVNIIGCSIYSTSFGHLFFIQGGRNVLFQDCYAEAATRTTDDMLAETSGPAFDVGFQAVYPNYNGEKVITPGYTKSLSECGFRTYGSGANGYNTEGVTFINCIARNTRVGFALEVGSPLLVQNCEATGNEAGFNVKNVTIENSRGDAVNGPLLYLSGDDSDVELELMPTLPTTTLHAIATIAGNNHNVTLTKWNDETRTQDHKILVGATRPTGTNPFSPLGSTATSAVVLNNCTEMPVEILSNTSSSIINTTGAVINNGIGNTVITDSCEGIENLDFDDGTYTYRVLEANPNICEVTGFVSGQDMANAIIPEQATNNSIPFDIVSVGVGAFQSNSIIVNVTLPSGVTNIGADAFRSCSNLTIINLENIITYGSHSFNGCVNLTLASLDFTNTTNVGDYCFLNCGKVSSVVVPGSVILGVGALRSTGITSFTIPDEWTVLPDQMIRDCKSITNINIPSTITTMGVASFRGCTGITDIQVNWTTSTSIPDATVNNLFSGMTLSNVNLLVPPDTVSYYEAAPIWTDFNIQQGVLSTKEAILENGFNIYPNPTEGMVYIKNKQSINATILIYDVRGSNLFNKIIDTSEIQIDVSSLSKGIYLLKIQAENNQFVKRIVKQ